MSASGVHVEYRLELRGMVQMEAAVSNRMQMSRSGV
jgi:hypothetical protein